MNHPLTPMLLAALLAGCAGTATWQGAEAEKAYDKQLDAARATLVLNNDDYYEHHRDGKIYVIADVKDLQNWQASGELPLRMTQIGAGPQGETVVFAIAGPESKKKDGFGAVEMFYGRRKGSDKEFYGEVFKDGKYYVFDRWEDLEAFRASGSAAALSQTTGAGGQLVLAAQPADKLIARFNTLHPQ